MVNWGSEMNSAAPPAIPPGMDGYIAPEKSPSEEKENASTPTLAPLASRSIPSYITARRCICGGCNQRMLSTIQSQLYAKLCYQIGTVPIRVPELASTIQPCMPLCASCQVIPTEESIAHAYYGLLVRLGILYTAIRANPNYKESANRDKWFSAHIERANALYYCLAGIEMDYEMAHSTMNRQEEIHAFKSILRRVAVPLPSL